MIDQKLFGLCQKTFCSMLICTIELKLWCRNNGFMFCYGYFYTKSSQNQPVLGKQGSNDVFEDREDRLPQK